MNPTRPLPRTLPRLVKPPPRAVQKVEPSPVAAAPPPPPPPVCHTAGCQVVVPQKGMRCLAHRAAWLAKRFYAPEPPDAVFTCLVPGCAVRVPHRDFLCEAHWALVTKKRQSKLHWAAEHYHVVLGEALEDVAKSACESVQGSAAG